MLNQIRYALRGLRQNPGFARRVYDFATTLGLVLAVVGLYAVVSFQVSRRTREIGIRMALGAERAQVAQIFLKQALLLSAGGVTIGAAASVSANRASESILGGEPPSPVLLGALSAALLLTTVAAAWIPARTASRVDPQQALRQD